MVKKDAYNESIMGDEGFAAGDGYPSLDGEPADNMTEGNDADADTMAGDRSEAGIETADRLPEEDTAAQCAEWQDKYLRLQAEFDNFRKRTLREKMELLQMGGADTVQRFLPLVDDVQRALEAFEKSDDKASLTEGVRLIAQKFADTLRQQNVTEIEAVGLELDTDRHEAVARIPVPEKKHRGKIVEVVQTGYRMGDRVLRFAKVVVGE